tara:strand:+ start:31499 stop:32059 length:561 start_codon:yes stop_codon:yes gene_type:complete
MILWVSSNLLHAQSNQFNAQNFLESSVSIQKTGMVVLGSWALMNIFSGIPGAYYSKQERKYFYQMNATWNIVNFGIATVGYLGVLNGNDLQSSSEILKELQNFDRILLINASLDFAYIGTGVWLWNKGIKKDSVRLDGYGKSLVLQGSFLLLFDSILYYIHHHQTNRLNLLNGTLVVNSGGLTFSF